MNESLDNEIIHRWNRGQSMRGIARDLGLNRKRVARVIRRYQQSRRQETLSPELPPAKQRRGSQLDSLEETIKQLLARYPEITAIRIHEELKKLGYEGGYTILRERVRELRQRPRKPLVTRFETSPGVQAQMDWSTYEIDFTGEGRRRVNLFSYLLGYSRRQYLHFTERQDFETTIAQHIRGFEHLRGLAATCLYDNMKVVVTRWEDDHPIYNTRFLSFATHYGFRPWACRPRRPETKGKVERPFAYVETSLLNGRTFRSLEHLNEVTRWWLANVADIRQHRQTGKRPVDAHAEELPHLLPLPEHHYDTAKVVYRVVDAAGFIAYLNNEYSAPWKLVGATLPVRILADEMIIYNHRIQAVGRHGLLPPGEGRRQMDPAHRPPPDQREQLAWLRERFAEFEDLGLRFLEGLLGKQRYGKHQARKILTLLHGYRRDDVRRALERAVNYHAYSFTSLQRILALQATPKAGWPALTEQQEAMLRGLTEADSIPPRSSAEYQHLLFEKDDSDDPQKADRGEDP
jgi:transposase